MDTVFVKAVPTRALAFDALQIPFAVKLSAIVKHIVLPGNIENILGPAALQYLIKGVELFGLRQLREVSGVDKESRRSRHRIDAIESNLERLRHIFVCVFAETDVTVADLKKAEIRSRRQRVSCFRDLGKGSRRKHPAAYGPKEARAGPCHAVEKAAAIDSVVVVVVRNVIGHNIGFLVWLVAF